MIRNLTTAMALFLACASASAATCTWTGGGGNDKWSTVANWNNCGGAHALPTNGDTLVFPNATSRLTNTNDLANLQLAALQFNGLNYDISGNAVTLSSGIKTNTPVGGLADLGPRFRPNITLTADQAFFCPAGKFLYVDGTLDIGAHTLVIDGGLGNCSTALRGAVSGSGGIQKFETGTLYLSNANNTFSGETLIGGGAIYVNANAGLGAGTASGGGTSVQPGTTLALYGGITSPEFIYLDGGTLENFLGDNGTTYQIELEADSSVDVVYPDDTLTVNRAYGQYLLTKEGPGTFVLNGVEVDPALVVSEGTVELNAPATAPIEIKAGATLSGTGDMGSPTTIDSGGTLAPGSPANPGTISGSVLTWYDLSDIRIRLGKRSDRILLSGNLNAIGAEEHQFVFVDGDTPPKAGDQYTLAEYASSFGLEAAGDLNSAYIYQGTGAGATLTGTFNVGLTALTFTVTAASSDLVFRSGNEH